MVFKWVKIKWFTVKHSKRAYEIWYNVDKRGILCIFTYLFIYWYKRAILTQFLPLTSLVPVISFLHRLFTLSTQVTCWCKKSFSSLERIRRSILSAIFSTRMYRSHHWLENMKLRVSHKQSSVFSLMINS